MKNFKMTMKEIMNQAWQLVKVYGFTMSEALKKAWAIYRVKAAMYKGITKFYFKKVDGTIREAYGTLATNMIPPTGNHGHAKSVIPYYDTEKQDWRCFKVANLIGLSI